MDKDEVFDKLVEGKLTRRQVNKTLASLGLGVATLPLVPSLAGAAGEITYLTWSGYEDPGLHGEYVEKYGGSPEVTFFGDEEEALQKIRAGFPADVSHPCTDYVSRWRDFGILRPIEVSRLDHYGDVWPELKTIKGTWHEGQAWFVPIDWGNSSVLYRTDLVDPAYLEDEAWAILFDERYKGRLAAYDSDSSVIVAGLVAGVEDPFDMRGEELERVKKLMQKQRKLLRFYWSSPTDIEQALAAGELVAAYAWNEGLVHLKEQGLPVAFANPKEGILTWVCGLVHLTGGKGPDEAVYDFIDAMLAPTTGKYEIEAWGYGHANQKAFDLVPTERLAELGISSPAEMFAQSTFFREMAPEVQESYITLLEEVKAGF